METWVGDGIGIILSYCGYLILNMRPYCGMGKFVVMMDLEHQLLCNTLSMNYFQCGAVFF
jgi:hypothetical protein